MQDRNRLENNLTMWPPFGRTHRRDLLMHGAGMLLCLATASTCVAQDKPAAPLLAVDETFVELGKVIAGDKVLLAWVLRNQGDAPLRILRVAAGCGCTIIRLAEEDKVIPPGESLRLVATFDSTERQGDQLKHIFVISNDPENEKLKLEFHAFVEVYYTVKPPRNLLNLRTIRRGYPAGETLELTPSGSRELELLEAKMEHPELLTHSVEPLGEGGVRIRFQAGDEAPVGQLTSSIHVRFRVDGLERDVNVTVTAEVVADLVTLPEWVRPLLTPIHAGQRLAPVVVRTISGAPFDVTHADGDPYLDVFVAPARGKVEGAEFVCNLMIKENAPPGPFGVFLTIHTNSLDQPVLRVPVFGIVALPVQVEPEIVVLQDGSSPTGRSKRVKLTGPTAFPLEVTSAELAPEAIDVEIHPVDQTHPAYERFVTIMLQPGTSGEGDRNVILTTNVPGATRLMIPVRVQKP